MRVLGLSLAYAGALIGVSLVFRSSAPNGTLGLGVAWLPACMVGIFIAMAASGRESANICGDGGRKSWSQRWVHADRTTCWACSRSTTPARRVLRAAILFAVSARSCSKDGAMKTGSIAPGRARLEPGRPRRADRGLAQRSRDRDRPLRPTSPRLGSPNVSDGSSSFFGRSSSSFQLRGTPRVKKRGDFHRRAPAFDGETVRSHAVQPPYAKEPS